MRRENTRNRKGTRCVNLWAEIENQRQPGATSPETRILDAKEMPLDEGKIRADPGSVIEMQRAKAVAWAEEWEWADSGTDKGLGDWVEWEGKGLVWSHAIQSRNEWDPHIE